MLTKEKYLKISKSDRVIEKKNVFSRECVVRGAGSKLLYKSNRLLKHEERNKLSGKNVFEGIIVFTCENF